MLRGFARHSWTKPWLSWSSAGFETLDYRPPNVPSNQGFCPLLPYLSKLFCVRAVYSCFSPAFSIALLVSLHQFYSARSVSEILVLNCAFECVSGECIRPPHLFYHQTSSDLLFILKRGLHFSGIASRWHVLLLWPLTFHLHSLSLRFLLFPSLWLSGVPFRICSFILMMLVWT